MIEADHNAPPEHDPVGRQPQDWTLNVRQLSKPAHSLKHFDGNSKPHPQITPASVPMARSQILAQTQGLRDGALEAGEDTDSQASHADRILRLSATQLQELTSSAESHLNRPPLKPMRSSEMLQKVISQASPKPAGGNEEAYLLGADKWNASEVPDSQKAATVNLQIQTPDSLKASPLLAARSGETPEMDNSPKLRPPQGARSLSTPSSARSPRAVSEQQSGRSPQKELRNAPAKIDLTKLNASFTQGTENRPLPSPIPLTIPVPPLSLPTYLQLELSSHRPSSMYIHRSVTSDFPYESSRVKIERLLNFIFLPFYLESALFFGTLACFDAWLYTFTILPLRLLKSCCILGESWSGKLVMEAGYLSGFVYDGVGRLWQRNVIKHASASAIAAGQKSTGQTEAGKPPWPISFAPQRSQDSKTAPAEEPKIRGRLDSNSPQRHRRSKSVPSALLPNDKANILKGFLIICTCAILMRFDASRMYHWIRGQAAIKLYVIYNVLEVSDRLFSAIGQDVLECLFSREALERRPDGHSKVFRPFWLFLLALVYSVTHSTALFYQVITLNVAVNSYSNALITLLMSNLFVEIKSTVFKKFEKENLFQLTCADVVERFQLWLMLTIIASRNIVETGGLNVGFSAFSTTSVSSLPPLNTNSSFPLTQAMPPRSSSMILPKSFKLVPAVLDAVTAYVPALGHVLGPFLVVLGSEVLVDWVKHAYINKFNNTRPAIYGRFLDVLAKDYYVNAFGDQNLTKRLGLPVIPLSCLFIRASAQTYQMFLAAWIPAQVSRSTTTLSSLNNNHNISTSMMARSTSAAISQKIDDFLQQMPSAISSSPLYRNFSTILAVFLVFLVLLALKLVLGMLLLSFSRSRYRSMKEREKASFHYVEGGRRVGGWGVVEVDDDKRKWIYEGDPEGGRASKEREERERARRGKDSADSGLEKVNRYEMVAKRIW